MVEDFGVINWRVQPRLFLESKPRELKDRSSREIFCSFRSLNARCEEIITMYNEIQLEKPDAGRCFVVGY